MSAEMCHRNTKKTPNENFPTHSFTESITHIASIKAYTIERNVEIDQVMTLVKVLCQRGGQL